MSDVRGSMWVDPEGVKQLGNRYAEHANIYAGHLRRLQTLRSTYKDAWGDDDTGRQFSERFLSGLDNLESLVGGVKGTLDYTAAGLRSGGTAYGDADDDARQAGHKMARNFGNVLATNGGGGGTGGSGDGSGGGGGSTAQQPGLLREATSGAKPHTGALTPATPAIPLSPTAATRATLAEPLTAATPALPANPLTAATPAVPAKPLTAATVTPAVGIPANGTPATPFAQVVAGVTPAEPTHGSFAPTTPSVPASPAGHPVLVGGQPLADGFRLELVHPLADGTSRVDANLYDAVSPVGFTSVTAADGTPLDAGNGQFFVVKDNPLADPRTDGYRPMYVNFSPGHRA
ncbi:hypothetical protein [Actinoplanes solisilvae]|uniref:hypothetical protein n=1 Tax=Actinoplanes solisilvae TaxID=2486853 RepID=UPI000FD93F37|nr:hypothetical protein [Actinoplanes solisilvae]